MVRIVALFMSAMLAAMLRERLLYLCHRALLIYAESAHLYAIMFPYITSTIVARARLRLLPHADARLPFARYY